MGFYFNFGVMMKQFRRSHDKMIAGVCAGIAEYLDLDPSLVRVGYVLLSIFSAAFPGILVYIILWIVLPERE
jgi:phage shock protein C